VTTSVPCRDVCYTLSLSQSPIYTRSWSTDTPSNMYVMPWRQYKKLCDSPKTTNCVTIQQTALHWVDESNLVELEDSPRPKSKRQLNVLRFAKQGLSESRSRPAHECKKDSCVYFLIRHDGGCKPGPVWCAPSELYEDHESTYV
jgi:hypothetical protein